VEVSWRTFITIHYRGASRTKLPNLSSARLHRSAGFSFVMTNALFTSYCLCTAVCCPLSSKGINAAGKAPVEGHSIAAPRNIPLGTRVMVKVPGALTNVFVVDDRTAVKYNGRWDIYMTSHKRALIFGKRKGTVEILP
jgi:3D (Asp-Asp-Asp) domain-containing protein